MESCLYICCAPKNPVFEKNLSSKNESSIEIIQRCSNYVIGDSDHCLYHRSIAQPLYMKYNKFCDKVQNFKYDLNDVENLLKYYSLLNEAYNARRDHRKIAYIPEYYDRGHNFQFEILNEKITQCELWLSVLFSNKLLLPN